MKIRFLCENYFIICIARNCTFVVAKIQKNLELNVRVQEVENYLRMYKKLYYFYFKNKVATFMHVIL